MTQQPEQTVVPTKDDLSDLVEENSQDFLDPKQAQRLSQALVAAKLQDVLGLVERLPAARAAIVFRFLERSRAIRVFELLDAGQQADLVGALRERDVYQYFEALDPDDRVSLLDELPAEVAQRFLRSLDADELDYTDTVLGYPKRSVGRRMSPEVAFIESSMTAGEAIAHVRDIATMSETIYTLPVVTKDRVLVGVCTLRGLLVVPEDQPVTEIMQDPVVAHTHDDAEETARWFLSLDLLAMPIVDDSERLVGILTVDDAHDLVELADSEDSARSGGSEPLNQPYLSTPLFKLVRSRVVWLLVLAVSALLTVQVLEAFEDTLAAAVVLSLFIPLLTGTGGNTGNQAATTVTRALALGDVSKRDIGKVAWREMRVGATLGALLGSLGFGLATAVYGLNIGIVIGSTLFCVCLMSATVGGMMPILAKAIGADPAVFSNPFISTFCDAVGLIVYFLIAKSVLGL